MKKILVSALLLILLGLFGCASTPVKYEKQPFTPPVKVEVYKLPADPFAGVPAPVPVFLKKDPNGFYVVTTQQEAELTAFVSKELGKITLRIQYYKEILPQMEHLINVRIQRENALIDIIVDQNLAKELYRELFVEMQNKNKSDKFWGNAEKAGLWAIIIAQLALLISTL